MIDLVRLEVKDFLSFESATLDLSKKGLYLISGWNQVGQDSNGSGKSAILGAICYALFGRTVTGLGPDAVKRWGSKGDTVVSLELVEGDTQYKIVRTGNVVQFYEKGKLTSATHKRDIQSVINETFKTNFELFTSSTYFSSTREFLAALTDKEKKQLFKPIFQLDRIDKAYEKTKEMHDNLLINLDNLQSFIALKETVIKDRQNSIARLKDDEKNWAARLDMTVKTLQATKDAIGVDTNADLVQRVDDLADKISIVEESLAADVDLVDSWKVEWQDCQSEYILAQGRWKDNAEALAETQLFRVGTNCKYCGQQLTESNLKKHIEEVLKQQDSLTVVAKAASERSLELDRLLLEHDQKRERLQALRDAHATAKSALSMHLQQVEYNKERRATIEENIKAALESPCPFTEEIKKLSTQVDLDTSEVKESIVRRDAMLKRYDVLGFLKWVFSREGVSAFIIERAFGRLESTANRYLSMINTEGWHIEIRPQKELKSKALKEEIDIVITLGDQKVSYWGLSGGQRQRLNIALLLSVYRLCRDLGINNFNFLLLDEVLDLSLAEKGQADAVKMMRRLLDSEIGQIFVISHKPDVASDFDFVIETIRGKDKISRLS